MAEATVARARPTAAALRLSRAPAVLTLAALMAVAGLLLLYASRHLTYFYDEWDFILGRRGGSLGTYLNPHNGHLVLFGVLVYKFLFELVGLRHYTPYVMVAVALHLLSCALLYVLIRRRLGAWLALVPATLLLFMGSAYQDLLWPFQMVYLASVAGGLAALTLIDRPGRSRDAAAAVLLTWSVFSSGVGLAFAVACAVLLIARREPWPRLWIVALPLILFGIWYLGWSSGEQITSDSLLGAPQYDASAAAATAAGIAGLDQSWGPALVVALLAVLTAAWRLREDRGPSPMLLAAATGALIFWTLAGVTRADLSDPTASRYLYIGAVFVLLIAAEAARGARLRGLWLAPVLILLLGAVVANARLLRDGERSLRTIDTEVRASLGVVDVAAPVVSPGFQPDQQGAPQITAGPYLAAAHHLGSPALSVGELERAPASLQIRADEVLLHAERLAVTPTGGTIGRQCRQLSPGTGGALALAVPAGSELGVQTRRGRGALIYLRRFASQFGSSPLGYVPGGVAATVSFPADRATGVPWHVRLSSSQALRACVS